jgi:hypothetical protein
MRDLPLVMLVVTLLTFSVSAQVTSVKEFAPQLNKSRQIWREVVENQDSRSVVALHTTFHCPTRIPSKMSENHVRESEAGGEYDALGNPVDIFEDHKGIPPGGAVTVAAADPSKCRGGVDTVIFSDGHIEGKSPSVREYRQRWAGVHEGIIQTLPLLAKVANQEADLAEVEDVLRERMESIPYHPLEINRTFDSKRWGERAVYGQLESLLRGTREHPKPRTEEVEAIGTRRKQAQEMAIFLVDKLQEWKTALENGLESPAAK